MRDEATFRVKAGLAEMLKGGVIMDVVDAEQAKLAEDAGAAAVMALERVPSDIRRDGGVARMSDPSMIRGIQEAVSIPVMAKARTLAITDATLSEVAKLAQIRLYYSSNSPAYVRSHAALLSIIQALAYGVYSRDAEQYADRIKAFRLK